jgi:tetratricopeptide (TPR) repeat protein
MIPMMFYFFRNVSFKQLISVFGLLALARVIFALTKKSLLEDEQLRMFSYVENPLFDLDFYARIPMYFYSNLVYFEKLILPYPLSFYYGYNAIPLVGYTDWRFFLAVAVMLVALYFAIIGLKKKSIVSFSILFFLMSIGGAANLLSPMVGIVGERFAFIGSIGFCILVVYLLFHFLKLDIHETKIPSKIYFSLAIVILPSFIFTINRNKDWQSKKSLYIADSNHLINSAKANSLLGSELQEEAYKIQKESIYKNDEMMAKVDSAIMFYDRSLKIFPYYESNLNNRGALYFTFYYDYLESNRSFRISTERNKTYYEGMLNIGNSYAKLAEGYSNVTLNLPLSTEGNTSQIAEIDAFYRKEKIYRTLAIIRQFEVNASQQLKNGVNSTAVQLLTLNASNLEKLDPLLAKLQFSAKITQFLNLALQQNKIPNTQPLNTFRRSCVELMKNELQLNDSDLRACTIKLQDLYLDSAKIYFDKTYKLKPKMEQYYSSVSQFAMLLADYKLLIKVQNQYLKNFKNKYNTPQYVQLANAYYSLGDMPNAKLYFKKGMKDLIDEKNALAAKSIQTQADKNRIIGLENEVIRLKAFVQNLKAARKAK